MRLATEWELFQEPLVSRQNPLVYHLPTLPFREGRHAVAGWVSVA